MKKTEKNNDEKTAKKRPVLRWVLTNVILAVVFFTVIIVLAVVLLGVLTRHGDELVVPDMTNMSVKNAELLASNVGIRVEVTDSVYVRRMERGVVYKHDPKPGAHVKKGRRIMLTINAVTPKQVSMPNLVGYSMRQAKAELLARGLQLGKLIYINDIATNNVLSQIWQNSEIEPGTMVESETVIDLVVGLNTKEKSSSLTLIPCVIGRRYMSALDAVQDNSLNISELCFDETVRDYSDSLNAKVYDQTPFAFDTLVRLGSEVGLWLTMDESKIPDLTLLEEEDEEGDEEDGEDITAE
ncbi:MAG: PASTA domain-containing protein [Bacteroidales bacterium]|nr:PASTA domain-containing protein [Bacteroidales bacterium]